ncbi:MAG: ABC transporter substrate-binding protein [Alphaproteobacteria bacterium]|nr:ABC transporter substrate-binding protein [Alphaproteobacteria bacterium]
MAATVVTLFTLASTVAAQAQRADAIIGLQLEPPHLDPTSAAAGAIDQVLYANVFEGLTRFGPDGSVQPGLAASWTISDDGLSYTFQLREGVTFHDGTTFEASDVVFSLDRARAEDSTNAQKALFAGIERVEALGDSSVRIYLAAPQGNFLFNLAWGDAVMVAPESIGDIKNLPIGTGAFRFKQWRRGDQISLTRNADYWGEAALLEGATFKFISEPTAAYAAMLAGDIDAFYSYPAPENLAQFERDPRFTVLSGNTEGETILAMNNQQAPFDDIRVRKAVSHAIDRQAIIDGAMFGYGTPIGSHFAPHNPDYVDLTANAAFDPALARDLLAQAGYAEGFSTTLKLPPPSYARRGGEIIAAQLRKVGIEAEISFLEWAQWLEQVFRGYDYGLTIVSHTEPMDINIYARPDYYFQYDNPDFQALIETLAVQSDPAARSALLAQAQTTIAEDFVNGYLFQLALTSVVDAKLQGIWKDAPTQAVDLTGVRWAD